MGGLSLDTDLAAWICRRAGGNPLYAEELSQSLKQADAIILDRKTGEVRWTQYEPSLPLSLHELLLARFNELSLAEQDVLKRAALFGTTFEVADVIALCKNYLSPIEVRTALENIAIRSILTCHQPNHYHFNHPLMQEAIYTTLSFSQRQIWHTIIGDWLVTQGEDQFLPLIASHYLLGNDGNKAAQFGCRAGDRAREQRAYAGALAYYSRVLNFPEITDLYRARAQDKLGDVLAIRGDYHTACRVYSKAIGLGLTDIEPKRAILAQDKDQLAQLDPTDELAPWAMGAYAWCLVEAGQKVDGLNQIQLALQHRHLTAPTQTALLELADKIEESDDLPLYEIWLQKFVKVVLQTTFSTTELLDLPPVLSNIVRKIMREGEINLEDLATDLKQPLANMQQILDELVDKDYLRTFKSDEQVLYKVNLGFKRYRTTPSKIWETLRDDFN